MLPRRLLRTDAGQAAAAQAWLFGMTQREIAAAYGFKNPSPVTNAIWELINKYVPEVRDVGGYNRRFIAALALDRHCGVSDDPDHPAVAVVARVRQAEEAALEAYKANKEACDRREREARARLGVSPRPALRAGAAADVIARDNLTVQAAIARDPPQGGPKDLSYYRLGASLRRQGQSWE